jgi:hypothetical protein
VLTVDVHHVVLGGGVAQLGQPLLDVVRDALREQADASPFLASLGLPGRVTLAPADVPVAAVGAAVLGRRDDERSDPQDTPPGHHAETPAPALAGTKTKGR